MRARGMGMRRLRDALVGAAGLAISALLLAALLLVLAYVFYGAALRFEPEMLLTMGNTTSGGLLNAIVGTWLLSGLALAISALLAIFVAIDIAQYAGARVGSLLRATVDTMAAIPAMVYGLFGFLVFVIYLGMGYSLLAGSLTLSLMMIPYLARSTETAMGNVPKELVAAAYALGASRWQVISRVLLRFGRPLIISGALLAVSIGAGETAQLLYTAGWNPGLPTWFTHSQVGYLTYVVWAGINQPTPYPQGLAFVASALLVGMILVLLLISKWLEGREVRRA